MSDEQPEVATKRGELWRLPRSPQGYLKEPGRTWPKIMQWLNALWQLRACNHLGRWTRLRGRIFVENHGELIVGDRVLLHSHYARSVLATFGGGRLEIGARTFINYGTDIAATHSVTIGTDCLIGTHVIVLDNDFHELRDRQAVPTGKPIRIGNGVWIGNRVIILPGVTIGDESVIGAGSVVTSDVPAHVVVAGNPARIVSQGSRQ